MASTLTKPTIGAASPASVPSSQVCVNDKPVSLRVTAVVSVEPRGGASVVAVSTSTPAHTHELRPSPRNAEGLRFVASSPAAAALAGGVASPGGGVGVDDPDGAAPAALASAMDPTLVTLRDGCSTGVSGQADVCTHPLRAHSPCALPCTCPASSHRRALPGLQG